MSDSKNVGLPTRFGFLLLHDFTLISLSSAIEPLRMTNRVCDQNSYSWKTISESGGAVTASNGLKISVDSGIGDHDVLNGLDVVIVCGGVLIEKSTSPPVLSWLKAVNRKGVSLGAICTGSFALAKAGLLNGYRCSVHWENMASMTEMFSYVDVSGSVFTIDRDRYTSSGGTTPIDMMLHFIRNQLGSGVCADVAELCVYKRIRHSDESQHMPLQHSLGGRSRRLLLLVELMEANIREPLSQEDLATYVNVSRRQLQRLFQRHMQFTPSQYYMHLRLQRARELLLQTSLSLTDISSMTGFVSTSHFSKSYKESYGYSPRVERQQDAGQIH